MRAIAIVAGFVLAAAAGGGWLYFKGRRPPATAPAVEESKPNAEPSFSGKIRPQRTIPIPAPIEGTLESVEVIDGQEVYEGMLLARIQNSRLELEQEQAQLEVERLQTRVQNLEAQLIAARLEASRADADASRSRSEFGPAEKNFLRQQTLLREGATPRQQFDKSEKEYARLKSESEALTEMARQAADRVSEVLRNLEEARKQLAERTEDYDDAQQQMLATEVHSPVDGVLFSHRVDAGGQVTRDMKDLFQVAISLAELELVVDLTPAARNSFRPGQEVVIQVAEAGNQPIGGRVKSVNETQAVIEFQSPEAAVKPGLTAQVRPVPGS
jgi:HlyD family secretion protein